MDLPVALKQWHDVNGALYDEVKRLDRAGDLEGLRTLQRECRIQFDASKAVIENLNTTVFAVNDRLIEGRT